jgi:hypothetical protein
MLVITRKKAAPLHAAKHLQNLEFKLPENSEPEELAALRMK